MSLVDIVLGDSIFDHLGLLVEFASPQPLVYNTVHTIALHLAIVADRVFVRRELNKRYRNNTETDTD